MSSLSNLWKSLSLLLAVALVCSCATAPAPPAAAPLPAAAPAPAPTPAPAPQSAPPAAEKAAAAGSHICNGGARYVTFESLGVPAAARAVDLVSTDHYDYVLFSPALLVRLARDEPKVQVETLQGEPGQTWKALALDPIDNSLWVATDQFVLIHVSPSLHSQALPLKKVAGSGGFVRLAVSRDAIYAAPVCADDAVWRIDRDGRVLSSAFRTPRPEVQPEAFELTGCSHVRLDYDPEGRVVAWDWAKRTLRRVDSQGEWREVDAGVFATLPDPKTLKGVEVGTGAEQWYFSGASGLFLWKGKPVFLGARTIRAAAGRHPGADTVLLLPEPGGAREIVEACHGAAIQRVATAGGRYAALAGQGIVLGDMASAPDLP